MDDAQLYCDHRKCINLTPGRTLLVPQEVRCDGVWPSWPSDCWARRWRSKPVNIVCDLLLPPLSIAAASKAYQFACEVGAEKITIEANVSLMTMAMRMIHPNGCTYVYVHACVRDCTSVADSPDS